MIYNPGLNYVNGHLGLLGYNGTQIGTEFQGFFEIDSNGGITSTVVTR
jgi:hypothetical protein